MSTTTMDRSHRRRAPSARKPPPALDTRYPDPDPTDPFAPLWVLRTRSSNPAIDLDGLYASPPPVEAHYRRRSQSTPVEALSFPPVAAHGHPSVPSLLTDTTSDSSGSSTDVDTLVPSKPAFHVPRFFIPHLSSKPPARRVSKKSISPPLGPSPLPDLLPLRRAVTCDSPIESASISRKPPTTLKKPAPPVSSPLISSPAPSPTYAVPTTADAYTSPRAAPTPTPKASSSSSHHHIPHSSHLTPSRSLSLAPHPQLYPPPDAEWHPPTPAQLAHAASLPVIAESGLRVPFAALFAAQRTVVVFVRHFWCPLCQDYMSALVSAAQPHRMFAPAAAEGEDGTGGAGVGVGGTQPVHLVVVSNGAHAFIPKYRQLFGLPFAMYTDPELRVYRALGMGRDGGPGPEMHANTSASAGGPAPLLDGGYVRHGFVGGIAMVVARALRTGMPVWEKGGDIGQLGGEFVLGPG